jgi:hypothetical protein
MPRAKSSDALSTASRRPQTSPLAVQTGKHSNFTNWNYLGAVKVKIAGIPVPVAKKT